MARKGGGSPAGLGHVDLTLHDLCILSVSLVDFHFCILLNTLQGCCSLMFVRHVPEESAASVLIRTLGILKLSFVCLHRGFRGKTNRERSALEKGLGMLSGLGSEL